nr:reverse transcriptase domain-containing protein [Tanacetum cinerariifolium]
MDDFSVFGNSFQSYISYLERMLKRCEDTNLCLNWEKSHFMLKEGIVLGHKISKQRIKVDKAKVDVITKLPYPTTVKGIRSFLGHASFIEECVEAFQTLKRKLTKAPIFIAPDWDMPFELMCDASDFAISAVLGQHQEKHFRPRHYPSKTMTEAESNYTTTEKEMLAVVFRTPRAIISDRGTYFCNDQLAKVMQKYGVPHRLATPYHPQTSGQVDVSNCGLKHILERTVAENRSSWSDKLDDALWAFRTTYKTPIGCTPYKLIYGKVITEKFNSMNFVIKLMKTLSSTRKKLRGSMTQKSKTVFLTSGDRVLLFNSRLKIFSGKLKSRWSGPFTISYVYPYGTVELSQPDGPNFKVNGHRVKHYFGEDVPKMVVPDLQIFPKDH